MTQQPSEIHNLLLDAFERKSKRDSLPTDPINKTTIDELVKDVADVFIQQPGMQVSSDTPGGSLWVGLLAFGTYFKTLSPSDDQIRDVAKIAEVDYYGYHALRFLSAITSKTKPRALVDWENAIYLETVNLPMTPRGQGRFKNTHRDMMICSQIRKLAGIGIPPTRNVATDEKRESGCDIVVRALDIARPIISYAAVEKIWKNRHRSPSLDALTSAFLQAAVSE